MDKNLIGQKTVMMSLEGGDNPLGTLQGLGNQAFPAPNPLKSAVLVDNTYTYDNNANRIEKRTLAGLNRFAYDSVNRLVKAEYPTGAEEYRYDKDIWQDTRQESTKACFTNFGKCHIIC